TFSSFSISSSAPVYRYSSSGIYFWTLHEVNTAKAMLSIIKKLILPNRMLFSAFIAVFLSISSFSLGLFFLHFFFKQIFILVEFFRKYEGNSVDENLSVNDVFILIFTEAFHTESSVFGNEIFNGYIPDYRSAFFACLVCSLNIYFATYTQNKPIIKQFFLSCDV